MRIFCEHCGEMACVVEAIDVDGVEWCPWCANANGNLSDKKLERITELQNNTRFPDVEVLREKNGTYTLRVQIGKDVANLNLNSIRGDGKYFVRWAEGLFE